MLAGARDSRHVRADTFISWSKYNETVGANSSHLEIIHGCGIVPQNNAPRGAKKVTGEPTTRRKAAASSCDAASKPDGVPVEPDMGTAERPWIVASIANADELPDGAWFSLAGGSLIFQKWSSEPVECLTIRVPKD
jgi:hypothetical protein